MGGYEQTLGGFVGVAAVGFIGAGRFSLDAILPIPSWLRGWRAGVAAVVLGLVVGTIVMTVFGNGFGAHAPF